MSRRDFVTFDAEFPDDAQWDDRENLLVPGGKAVTEAIRKQLKERGFSCSDVVQHSFYGWAFYATSTSVKVWCLLQGGDEWFLLLEKKKPFFSPLFGSGEAAEFEQFQVCVQQILVSDKRFSKVLWHNHNEYKRGNTNSGCPNPH